MIFSGLLSVTHSRGQKFKKLNLIVLKLLLKKNAKKKFQFTPLATWVICPPLREGPRVTGATLGGEMRGHSPIASISTSPRCTCAIFRGRGSWRYRHIHFFARLAKRWPRGNCCFARGNPGSLGFLGEQIADTSWLLPADTWGKVKGTWADQRPFTVSRSVLRRRRFLPNKRHWHVAPSVSSCRMGWFDWSRLCNAKWH